MNNIVTVRWTSFSTTYTKWHASVSTGNFTACGLEVPVANNGVDVFFGFSGEPPTCKRCIKHLAVQEHARLTAESDNMMGGMK